MRGRSVTLHEKEALLLGIKELLDEARVEIMLKKVD